MARTGVTYLDVSNVANQLVASGKNPTIENIRQLLGTGSNSTLGIHLKSWKANQENTQRIACKEKLPEELVSALKGVWVSVMEQAQEKIEVVENKTKQEIEKLSQELSSLKKENTDLEKQYLQTKQDRERLESENSLIGQLLNDSKTEVCVLTEKQIGAELQNQEKQLRINELSQQTKKIQSNLEHYRESVLEQRLQDKQRYEQQQVQFEQTIQHLTQELTQTQKEKTLWQQQSQQLEFEKNSINYNLEKLEKEHGLVSRQAADLLSELAVKKQEIVNWQNKYNEIKTTQDEQNNTLINLQTQHAVVLSQIEILADELKKKEDQNKSLFHEKWTLGQEKAQLYGQLIQLESYLEKG